MGPDRTVGPQVVEVTSGVGLVLRNVRAQVVADVRERLGSTQCDLIVGLLDDQPDVVDLAEQLASAVTSVGGGG